MDSRESKKAVRTKETEVRELFPAYKNKEKGDNNND